MATVDSSTWVGAPPSTPLSGHQPRPAAGAAPGPVPVTGATNTGTMGALGLTPHEIAQKKQQTGVDPGAGGYVSGQAPPNGGAMAALGASQLTARSGPPAGAAAPNSAAPPGSHGPQVIPSFTGSWRQPVPADTTTIRSGLASAAPGPARTAPLPAPGGDVTTQRSALSVSSPAANGAPNTTDPGTGTTTKPALVSTGNAGLDRALDPGGIFTGATMTDTSPALASQKAAFGLSDQFGGERYDYRPGEAASQNVVHLNTADADATRGRQQTALDRLTDAANGTTPSAAELQMREEAGRNVAATLGQARAIGGRSAGGAARAGTLATADLLAKNTMDAAQLRAAEQDRNRANLVTALGGVRGQDVDTAAKEAGLTQDAYSNNLRSQIEQDQLAEQHRQKLIEAQLQALGIGSGAASSILNAGAANANADNKQKGGILSTVGGIFGS